MNATDPGLELTSFAYRPNEWTPSIFHLTHSQVHLPHLPPARAPHVTRYKTRIPVAYFTYYTSHPLPTSPFHPSAAILVVECEAHTSLILHRIHPVMRMDPLIRHSCKSPTSTFRTTHMIVLEQTLPCISHLCFYTYPELKT